MRKTLVLVLILASVGLIGALPCAAVDTWTDVMPGVRHLHRVTSTPWDIHVVVIDLTNPRVRLRVGIKNDHDKGDCGETVRSMCSRYGAVAGINCDFWGGSPVSHCPQGHTMTDGLAMLPPGYVRPINPDRTTLMLPADNAFALINKVTSPLSWWHNVAAGGPRLIRNGTVGWESEPDIPDQTSRHPRTGAAVTQDWHTLILATCDGRQPGFSVGMTGDEMGTLLKEFGGYNGMAFDGGGSTTMVVNGATVNRPSDGVDRAVANCLMVLDRHSQGANPTVHFESGFENLPYPLGMIGSVDGWVGSGDVVAEGRGGGQCARFEGQGASRQVSAVSLKGVRWVECWVRSSSTASNASILTMAANGADAAAVVRLGSGGKIEALDGNGSGGGTWIALADYTAGTWYRIHIRLDYNLNSYQAFVNGALKISGAGFRSSGASAGLTMIRFEEAGAAVLYVDDVYAGSVAPDSLRVTPDFSKLVVGSMKQFGVVNGSGSVSWNVVEERAPGGVATPPGTIAQISSTGLLSALSPGTCVVLAQDSTGRTDRSAALTIVARQVISQAKMLADGAEVALGGLVVTAVFDGFVYAEEPDRSSGIRILTTKPVNVGDTIYVTGTLNTIDGERVVCPIALEL